jgi:hypothetical protein
VAVNGAGFVPGNADPLRLPVRRQVLEIAGSRDETEYIQPAEFKM